MESRVQQVNSSPLLPTVIDGKNLLAAWERVEENAGAPGIDGISIEIFGLTLERELARLQKDLRDHTYRPQSLLRVCVNKPQGGQRMLGIPTVRDRVAQTAVTLVMTPLLESEFEDVSFGYRRGRSVEQALFKVRQYRDEGYQWVVDSDLDAFFDNVDWTLLHDRLVQSINDPGILQLIELWLQADVRKGTQFIKPTKGIPQGGPISPVLANLYLDRFDEEMVRRGYKLIRYADDFLILCKEKPQAEKALRLTETLLGELRLTLKPEKTRIAHFSQGFHYLGTLFVRTLDMPTPRRREKRPEPRKQAEERTDTVVAQALGEALEEAGKTIQDFPVAIPPPAPLVNTLPDKPASLVEPQDSTVLPEPLLQLHTGQPSTAPETGFSYTQERPVGTQQATEDLLNQEPPGEATPAGRRVQTSLLRTLYIQEQGSILARDGERLVVKKEGEVLLEVPAAKINQIFIFGNCTITTPAMTYCLKEDIPIVLLSSRGTYYGTIDNPLGDNISLHRQQFARAADPEFCLTTAKTIIAAKLHNCRLLLQRQQRRKQLPAVATAIERLSEMSVRLSQATTVEEVTGYEGAGAARYFAALGQLVDPVLKFTRRTRQPPTDPVNSLLSLGYTLLFYNLYALIIARGLHPYVGHLHLMRDRHPALASDLIEEFRAPIVDSLVLYLVNSKIITEANFFRLPDGPCLLKDEARKTFLRFFEQRMSTQVTHPHTGVVTDYRRCLDLQVYEMAQWIRGEIDAYRPMRIR